MAEWWETDPLLLDYHNHEWGVPKHNDRDLFELLCMETLQAGLSWVLVLRKREHFREVFHDFDVKTVAAMPQSAIEKALTDPGLIRNRRKLEAIITNAQATLRVQAEFGSFDKYLWGFTNGKQIVNQPHHSKDIPSTSPLSVQVAKDMKGRGYKFVGPTTVYSFLEGSGVIDDHLKGWVRPE